MGLAIQKKKKTHTHRYVSSRLVYLPKKIMSMNQISLATCFIHSFTSERTLVKLNPEAECNSLRISADKCPLRTV